MSGPQSRVNKHRPHHPAGGKRADKLANDVWQNGLAGEPPCDPKSERDCRVQVRTGCVADRINHGHNDKTKRQSNPNMGYLAAGRIVDDDRPGAGKHKRETCRLLRQGIVSSWLFPMRMADDYLGKSQQCLVTDSTGHAERQKVAPRAECLRIPIQTTKMTPIALGSKRLCMGHFGATPA